MRELPDGRWQSRQYLDVKGEIYRVVLTMNKEGDTLIFDFTGSSPQSKYSVNCSKWASLGGSVCAAVPAALLRHRMERRSDPADHDDRAGGHDRELHTAGAGLGGDGRRDPIRQQRRLLTIGKMLAASEKYADEATAVWHANHFAIFMFGNNQRGRLAIGILTETFAGAGGARTFADGVDIGGEIPNPISRMANVETIEATFPSPLSVPPPACRFRRPGQISRRYGRRDGDRRPRRAGRRHPLCALRQGLEISAERRALRRISRRVPTITSGFMRPTKDHNIDRFAQSFEEIPGEKEPISWGVFPLMGDDALYVRWNGGGGVGDPLERSIDKVARRRRRADNLCERPEAMSMASLYRTAISILTPPRGGAKRCGGHA